MKTIISYIRESLGKGTMFKDKVKYTATDWSSWCKEISSNKNIEIFDVEENKQKLHLIYLDNKHIATYNPKTQELMTDDISHFGHVVTEGEEKKDDKTTERAGIKFTIWKEPDTKVDWLEEDDPFQKIEYVFKDKKKNITIDFLLGVKDGNWQLWAGKEGAVNYDDDPFYDLEEQTFAKGIIAALDKVQEIIADVKDNPDNWAQFYIKR